MIIGEYKSIDLKNKNNIEQIKIIFEQIIYPSFFIRFVCNIIKKWIISR